MGKTGSADRDAAYRVVTERILAKLEQGVVPWRKTWRTGEPVPRSFSNLGTARNLVSGKAYRGVNAILTGMQGFESPWWVTFKQARDLGGTVRKGERGTPIVFWSKLEVRDAKAKDGKREVMFVRYSTAFNLDQTEGVRAPEERKPLAPVEVEPTPEITPFTPIEAAELIAAAHPMATLRVQHGGGSAYYSPELDYVNLPAREAFDAPEAYYSTLFHELTHATGHAERLNREGVAKLDRFGSHQYSKEELIAEMGSAFLCNRAGIEPQTIDNAAAYIGHWLKVLRDDPKFVVQAAAKAQQAADYLLNVKPEVEAKPEPQEAAEASQGVA